MKHHPSRTRDAASGYSIREAVGGWELGFDEPGLRTGFDDALPKATGTARPSRRFGSGHASRTRAGRVGRWLFMDGGMSPVLIVGMIAFGVIAGALYGH